MATFSTRPPVSRRTFLADTGMGFTGLALGAMLCKDGVARAHAKMAPPDGRPHFAPKAKSVIWIFLCGGVSHVESFDVKPELNRYAGQTIAEHAVPRRAQRRRAATSSPAIRRHGNRHMLMGLNTGYRRYGQMRARWSATGGGTSATAPTTSPSSARCGPITTITAPSSPGTPAGTRAKGAFPTIGSWIYYGLGTLNQNLPQYVVLGTPTGDCCGGSWTHGAAYLGPEHAGVRLNVGAANPLPFVAPGAGLQPDEQAAELEPARPAQSPVAASTIPTTRSLRARIRAYELASGMQTAVPETLQLERETEATRRLYGIDNADDAELRPALPGGAAARRARRPLRPDLPRRRRRRRLGRARRHPRQPRQPVRPGRSADRRPAQGPQAARPAATTRSSSGAPSSAARRARRATAATIIRTGFCAWLAGGGIKGGVVHGATDEIGFHAVENRHYVTDIHATVLHQLGLDARRLEVPGRRRLDIDYGQPIREIMA